MKTSLTSRPSHLHVPLRQTFSGPPSPSVRPEMSGIWPAGAFLVALCLLGASLSASGAVFAKADNSANLSTAASWTNNAAPGSSDIAQWDATVQININTAVLGTNVTWSGIKVLNPGGPITIPADGNSLTNGASGINLSAASQNLTINAPVVIAPNAMQTWNVGSGLTLTTTNVLKPGTPAAIESGFVQFGTTGAIVITNTSASQAAILDSMGNPWATYGSGDWAAVVNGVVGAAAYTEASGGTVAGNYDMDVNGPNVNGSTVNSVRCNASTNVTMTISSTKTFTTGGILMTPNSGGLTINSGSGTDAIRPTRGAGITTGAAFYLVQNSMLGNMIFNLNGGIANASSGTPVLVVKTGPGQIIFNTAGNSYTAGTMIYQGTVTVNPAANLGAGPVTVNGGNLQVFSGGRINLPSITLNSGGTNTITVGTANGQFNGPTNILNSGCWLTFNYSNGVPLSTTTAPLLVNGSITSTGTVNIGLISANLTTGTFPLIKYTNGLAGSGFAAFNLSALPLRVGALLSNDTASSSIDLIITNIAEPIHWAVGNGSWDIGVSLNWQDNTGATTTYQQTPFQGDDVLFADSASGAAPIITLNTNVAPGSMSVTASKNYTITGSGSIGGSGSLTLSGSGTFALQTANGFSGGVNIDGGVLSFAGLANLGSGPISFGGGTLQYNGNTDDISVRTVTLATGGGTINDDGATLNFANPIGNGGAGGLTKAGSGKLTLNGTNNYAGITVVNQGTIALGTNTYITNSSAIMVNGGATFDASGIGGDLVLGTFSSQILGGTGTVLDSNGTVWATNNTAVSPNTNGVYGTLTFGNSFGVSGGTLVIDVSTTNSDLIVVTNNLTVNGGALQLIVHGALTNGTYPLIRYGGSLSGDPSSLTISGFSGANQLPSLSSAKTNEIDLVIALGGNASLTWAGNNGNNWDINATVNWLSNGVASVFLNGDSATFNDSGNANVSLQTNVAPGAVIVNATNNNYVFTDGTGTGAGLVYGTEGITVSSSVGNITTFATPNNNTGPTVINGGTLQIGNGGIGEIGSGNVTNNGTLIFDQGSGATHNISSKISGTGSLVQNGSDLVVLQANNTFTGPTAISNSSSTLQVGNAGAAGTLGTGPVVDQGTLIINRSGAFALNNGISGLGQLIIDGPATLTLSGANTYQGNTYISNGVVKLAASEEVPDGNHDPGSTGWLILDGGATAGTFDLNGFNETINALSGLAGTVNGVVTNSGTASATNTLTIISGAGNTFNGVIADNASGSKTMVVLLSNSLQLNAVNTFSAGAILGSGATLAVGSTGQLGTGGIVMSNGATLSLPTTLSISPVVGNTITTVNGAAASFTSGEQANSISGQFVGGSTATNVFNGNISLSGTTQFSNFVGTVVISNNVGGTAVRLSHATGTFNGGDNTTFDFEGGSMATRNSASVSLGALTGSGGGIYNPTVAGPGTFIIGAKGVSTVFPGTITGTNNIVKAGAATLLLDGLNITTNTDNSTYTNYLYSPLVTYAGSTTISNGALALVVPDDFSNSPSITLAASTAVLDASQMGYVQNYYDYTQNPPAVTNSILVTNSTLELLSGQTLTGIGTIRGNFTADSGSILDVGLSLGTLDVTNNVVLAGAITMNINRTNAPNCSELSARNIAINSTATLVVTNLGPTNMLGHEVFQLFNLPVSGFASVTLPPLSAPFSWTNKLAIDGTIDVLGSLVNLNPTNISFTVSNGNLVMSWPADHIGWDLLVQTGHLSQGVSANTNDWMIVPGSSATDQVTVPLSATNRSEFYKMYYP